MGRQFFQEKYLNYDYAALREIGEARQQFLGLLCGIGLVRRDEVGYDSKSRRYNEESLLSASYYSNNKERRCDSLHFNDLLHTPLFDHGFRSVNAGSSH
jgi:hypothetical protein